MLKIPYYKRILSYLYPVRLWRGRSFYNPVLELLLYHNKHQLATEDSLYSDGDRYRPLRLAFDDIGNSLGKIKNVLVLGTGLGSAVEIFKSKGYYPAFTLVDNDEVILDLAKQILGFNSKITFVCADAVDFVERNRQHYDMVVVDTFINRVVPEAVTSKAFLEKCYSKINDSGHFVLNYIINDNEEWERVLHNINTTLPSNKVLKENINRVIVARV